MLEIPGVLPSRLVLSTRSSPILGDVFMLSSSQIELGNTVLCTSQDDLGGVDAFDIGCDADGHLGVDDLDRVGSLGQINDEELFVIYILIRVQFRYRNPPKRRTNHVSKLMPLLAVVRAFAQATSRGIVGLGRQRRLVTRSMLPTSLTVHSCMPIAASLTILLDSAVFS